MKFSLKTFGFEFGITLIKNPLTELNWVILSECHLKTTRGKSEKNSTFFPFCKNNKENLHNLEHLWPLSAPSCFTKHLY